MPPKSKGKKRPKAEPEPDLTMSDKQLQQQHVAVPPMNKKVTYPRRHLPSITRRSNNAHTAASTAVGYVRATPPGHNLHHLDNHSSATDKADHDRWTTYRSHLSASGQTHHQRPEVLCEEGWNNYHMWHCRRDWRVWDMSITMKNDEHEFGDGRSDATIWQCDSSATGAFAQLFFTLIPRIFKHPLPSNRS